MAYQGTKATLLKKLENLQEEVAVLKAQDEKFKARLNELDGQVSEIANLYEITKMMSATLLFNEIFEIFSEFLKRNFKFTACKLILIGQKGCEKEVEKIYEIGSVSGGNKGPQTEIPLIIQNEKVGVLSVEGLKEAALEKFLIVARQFSLEVEKVRLYERVQELAITDGLTGLFVRRYFLEMAKEELERSRRHKFKASFLMVDLDHFKQCNDNLGHLVGDFVLREVANVLKRNVREIDLVGRYGGEEFSLLLPETEKQDAILTAERLRCAVAEHRFEAYTEVVTMTISVGISTFPDDGDREIDLIEAADKAMYAAKMQGRNRVVGYSREMV